MTPHDASFRGYLNKGCRNCTLERLSKLKLKLSCSQLNITVASRFENQLSFQTNLLNMHQEKEHKELKDPTARQNSFSATDLFLLRKYKGLHLVEGGSGSFPDYRSVQ